MAMLTMGAQCTTSEPSCAADGDGNGVLECGAGEVAVCHDRCVPLGDVGDSCDTDLCATDHACRDGLTCEDGTCAVTSTVALLECNPEVRMGESLYCSSNTHCAPVGETCSNLMDAPAYLHGDVAGVCLLAQNEGERCDGEWKELTGGPLCQPCGPGMFCLPHPEHEVPVCQRECTTSDDCPCGIECGATGYCDVPCLPNRRRCEPESGLACCDASSDCLVVAIPTIGSMTISESFCCHGTGDTCVVDEECCPNARCNGGQCELCGSYPGATPTTVGCCDPLVPRIVDGDAVCALPCPLADAGTPCPESDSCAGDVPRYQCDPIDGDICPDGEIRGEGSPCVDEHWTEVCGFDVPGVLFCGESGWDCSEDSFEFCYGGDDAGQCGSPGFSCVPPRDVRCLTDRNCSPGTACVKIESGGSIINSWCAFCGAPDQPLCWPPTARGGCTVPPPPATEPCE